MEIETEIETGVAMPAPRVFVRRLSYEMKGMEVGQSFVCDGPTAVAYHEHCRYHGKRMVRRKLVDGSYRVWRVA